MTADHRIVTVQVLCSCGATHVARMAETVLELQHIHVTAATLLLGADSATTSPEGTTNG